MIIISVIWDTIDRNNLKKKTTVKGETVKQWKGQVEEEVEEEEGCCKHP